MEYFNEMPCVAHPFTKKDLKTKLAEKYDCGTCTYQGNYIVKSDVPLSTMSYYSTDGIYSYKILLRFVKKTN